jgi:DMSO reductase family type II enzyme heme b subunit
MARPRGKLLQAILVLAVAFLIFEYGVRPPMPASLLSLYMAITLLSVLVYVSSDSESWRAFVTPLWATLTEPGRRPLRVVLGVLFPLLVGYYAYSQAAARVEAPAELRAIHPAPPASITFRGKSIDLGATQTPVRQDIGTPPNAEKRARHLAAGGAIYIRNCVYCHGDNLDGKGHFAHGFNPAPADFTDPGTIAQLSEGFLFWRIAKGGPGLPKESTPWNSAMPAWEDRLTEEQIWQVIYYLFETTGYPPRVMDAGHAALPRPAAGGLPALLRAGADLVGPRAVGAQPAGDPGRGKALYEAKCALCHGLTGKGDGPAADLLLPRPRDFTAGKYKIRSTVAGQLPSDGDLATVIRVGMPGTSMPAWGAVIKDAKDMQALVAYVKGFAEEFKGARPESAKVPPEVEASEASIRRGKELFEAIECNKCHGQAGRGDPAPGSDLKDDWGHPVRPANLHKPWTWRGGPERKDVLLRLLAGVTGTPMPTFAGIVQDYKDFKKQEAEEKKDPKIWEAWKDATLWDVANYVRSLGPARLGWASLLQIQPATAEVPSDPDHVFWAETPGAHFPLVGQVVVDPRSFNPTLDLLTVRAVHTEQEVVFHLTWDDPTESDPAKGAPKPDRVALQFPTPGLAERPYFLMGEAAKPVYLLTWTAGAGVGEATAAGIGKLAPQAGEAVQAKGQAVYQAGQYRVVIRRPLRTPDQGDFAFPTGDFFPIAFWAWDGSEGDEGAKAAVTSWYYGRLETSSTARQIVVPPIAALVTAGFGFGLSRWAQRRRGRPEASG